MWHKFKKDLFSYYSMQKVNGVMGVNGIMRTCHIVLWKTKKKLSVNTTKYFTLIIPLDILIPCKALFDKIISTETHTMSELSNTVRPLPDWSWAMNRWPNCLNFQTLSAPYLTGPGLWTDDLIFCNASSSLILPHQIWAKLRKNSWSWDKSRPGKRDSSPFCFSHILYACKKNFNPSLAEPGYFLPLQTV